MIDVLLCGYEITNEQMKDNKTPEPFAIEWDDKPSNPIDDIKAWLATFKSAK